ncbi:MAG TPA: SDR family oxidoreductase [Stellaceae bacterium]|nr:SDR family oxidoreductase [Stellaceae bacterium]
MSRLFCFGLGYCGQALARVLTDAGWQVAGTTREEESRVDLDRFGYHAHLMSRDRPLADGGAAMGGATHVLVSVPPDAAGDPVLDLCGAEVAALRGLRWLGYLSTTAVYGDHGGAWVDETTQPRPSGERGRRRLAAEQGWRALARGSGLPLHIFRVAGIYGPGRSPLDAVRQGRAVRIDKPGHVFSRVHVADLVDALLASMTQPSSGAIYNICDDEPAPQAAVIEYACALLGVAVPPTVPFEAAPLSPMARSFYDDNKRVANRRIKDDLGVRLLYPSYREGLAAILAAETR